MRPKFKGVGEGGTLVSRRTVAPETKPEHTTAQKRIFAMAKKYDTIRVNRKASSMEILDHHQFT